MRILTPMAVMAISALALTVGKPPLAAEAGVVIPPPPFMMQHNGFLGPVPPPPFMTAPDRQIKQNLIPPPPAAVGKALPFTLAGHYVVQKGDNFWKLAKRFYGKGDLWEKIAAANPGKKARDLQIGDTLFIP